METLIYVLLSGIVFIGKSVVGKSIKKAGEAMLETISGGIIEEALEAVLERVFSAVGFRRQEKRQKKELYEKIAVLINKSKPDDFGSAIRFMEVHCPKNFDKTLLAPMRDGTYDDKEVIKKLVGELFDQLGDEQMKDLEYKSPEMLFAVIFDTDGKINPAEYPFLLGLLTILNDFFFLAKYHSMEKEDRDMLTLIGRITDDNTKKVIELLRPHLELLEQQNRVLAGVGATPTADGTSPTVVSATPLSMTDRAAAMANRDPFFFVRLECPECGSADIVRSDDTATCSRCRTSFLVVENAAAGDEEIRRALDEAKATLLASNASLNAEVVAGKRELGDKVDKLAAKMVSIEMFREMMDEQDAAGKARADAAVAEVRAAVAAATGDLQAALDDGISKLSQGILAANGKLDKIGERLTGIEDTLDVLPTEVAKSIRDALISGGFLAPLPILPTSTATTSLVRRRCPVCGCERAFALKDGYYRCPSCAFSIWSESVNDDVRPEAAPTELIITAQGRLDFAAAPTGTVTALRMRITPAVSAALLSPGMRKSFKLNGDIYEKSRLPILLSFTGCLPEREHIVKMINTFGAYTDELRIVLFGVGRDMLAKLCAGTSWRLFDDTIVYRKDGN